VIPERPPLDWDQAQRSDYARQPNLDMSINVRLPGIGRGDKPHGNATAESAVQAQRNDKRKPSRQTRRHFHPCRRGIKRLRGVGNIFQPIQYPASLARYSTRFPNECPHPSLPRPAPTTSRKHELPNSFRRQWPSVAAGGARDAPLTAARLRKGEAFVSRPDGAFDASPRPAGIETAPLANAIR
jgi:hypothetical protein